MIKFTKLSDEQRAEFESNGFLNVRGALDDDYRKQLIEAGDRLVASGARKNSASDFGEDGKPRSHDGYRNIVELDETFPPLLTMCTTVPLIMQLMSPRLQPHTSHLIWRHPSKAGTPETFRQSD